MPEPQPLDIFDHVYSTPNSGLARQQEHYSRYLASFGDPAEAASKKVHADDADDLCPSHQFGPAQAPSKTIPRWS